MAVVVGGNVTAGVSWHGMAVVAVVEGWDVSGSNTYSGGRGVRGG